MYDGAVFINGLSEPGAEFAAIFYEGSECDVELNPWQFNIYEGTEMDWGLATFPASPIDPNPIVLFEGESDTTVFQGFTYIPFVLQTGLPAWGWGTSDLTIHPVAYFSPTMYDGVDAANSSLATQMDLTADGAAVNYEGSEFDFIGLTTFPASPLISTYIAFYEGTNLVPSLTTHATFPFVLQTGLPTWSWGTSDLTICPGCNALISVMYEGTEMDTLDLETFEFFAIPMYEGAVLYEGLSTFPFAQIAGVMYEGTEMDFLSFSTQMDLTADGPAVNYEGSQMIWIITTNPPWTSANPIFYEGDQLISSLATQISITDWFYAGETAVVSLTTDPQYQPAPILYDGTAFIVPTIAAQQSLPVLVAYEGTEMMLPAVSNLANWYIYEGTELNPVQFSTTIDFTADGDLENCDGSWMFFALTTSPAQPLASQWPFYTGETLSGTLETAPAVFFSVVFWQDSYLQVDFSTSTHHIDLARQCSVAQPDSYFYWEDPTVYWMNLTNYGVQAQPGALATGMQSYMNVTIAFREVLQPEPFYQGDTIGIYDFWPLLDNVGMGTMGFGMTVLDLKFDLDIPLCYGNFIPDGSAVDAELATIDDTSCSVYEGYDGSTMFFTDFHTTFGIHATMDDGTYVASTLTTESGWFIQFWDGEGMFVASNVTMSPVMYEGEFLTVAFAPLTIIFYDGATFIAPPPNTNYTVEFMEVGCLQNEYNTVNDITITNPFGPPPTVNIELQPYYHQILAECF